MFILLTSSGVLVTSIIWKLFLSALAEALYSFCRLASIKSSVFKSYALKTTADGVVALLYGIVIIYGKSRLVGDDGILENRRIPSGNV